MAGRPAPSVPPRHRWAALYVLVLARVMGLLDTTIVSVAAPSVRAGLRASYTQLQWFGAAYTLALGAGLITAGRLGDRIGRRRALQLGVLGFTAASVLCGLAPSGGTLIACRVVQGAFAALMAPQQLGLVKTMFTPAELPKAFGVLGPAMGLATVVAPVVGGVVLTADPFGLGWRAVFWINVPIGVVLLLGSALVVAESRAPRPPRLDLGGIVLITVFALLLTLPAVQGRELGWPPWTLACLAAAVPVLELFRRYERRRRRRGGDPLVAPGLFDRRAFAVALTVGSLFFACVPGFTLVIMLYLQVAAHRTPLEAGLALLAWSIGSAVSSTWSGLALTARYGRPVLDAGLLLMAFSIAGLAVTIGPRGAGAALMPLLLFGAGFGMGLVLAPFLSIALWDVRDEEVGSASGVVNTVQQIAGSLGIAALVTAFLALAGSDHSASGMRAAIHPVLWIIAGILAIAVVLASRLPRRRAADQAPDRPPAKADTTHHDAS